jgi:hypothetical protein
MSVEQQTEANMKMQSLSMLSGAVALATALSPTGAPAWAQSSQSPQSRSDVVPCSLDGVNPADHSDVFSNPEVARQYGFVKGPDGNWQVIPNCETQIRR